MNRHWKPAKPKKPYVTGIACAHLFHPQMKGRHVVNDSVLQKDAKDWLRANVNGYRVRYLEKAVWFVVMEDAAAFRLFFDGEVIA